MSYVTEWCDSFLGKAYEEITDETVDIEVDPSVQQNPPEITDTEEMGEDVMVEETKNRESIKL